MSPTSQKGLLQGIFNSAHHLWSGHGLPRAFSSCGIRAARRTPTEEELSTMSAYQRWYYKKADDPIWWRRYLDSKKPWAKKYQENMKRTGRYAQLKENELANKRVRYHQKLEHRFTKCMNSWLFRLSVNVQEAFEWKTHLPVVYPERVRTTCSTCHAHHVHGARLW